MHATGMVVPQAPARDLDFAVAVDGVGLQPTTFRGVNMNTASHPIARSYVNTWIPPAGVVPIGDSIATRMAAGVNYEEFVLPNLSIKMPSFNATFHPAVTGGRRRAGRRSHWRSGACDAGSAGPTALACHRPPL